jgi:hypothetical protein
MKKNTPDNNSLIWFVAVNGKAVGPFTAETILEQIEAGQFSWAQPICKAGDQAWKRISETAEFKARAPKSSGARIWFVYHNNSQFGPFAQDEVERLLGVGQISSQSFVWKEGMPGWERIESVAAFKSTIKTAPARGRATRTETARAKDKRSSPRRPLVARVMVASERTFSVASASDVSAGGMQLLTETIPGEVGARLKLNVSADRIAPFVAEGVIVRISDDKRGFSFRFEKLAEPSRRAIEGYIQSAV